MLLLLAMKGHLSEIDFALLLKSLNSQLQQKSQSEYDGDSDRTDYTTDRFKSLQHFLIS